MGITVAVTGPTGQVGISAVAALEADPAVERIIGMSRGEFDPTALGWAKTEHRRGDILDPDAVRSLVDDADVLVHLAFIVLGSRREAERVNLAGTRTVVESAIASARCQRIVYTSSVAAYGYHRDNPSPLTEQTPVRGSDEHYYSRQKAAVEAMIAEVTAPGGVELFVLRPCIVAGPKATALADAMPWHLVPHAVRRLARLMPGLRVPLPDPGVPVQLVHHDDLARAIALCATTDASPGTYNIAGDGTVSVSDVVSAMGGLPVPVPGIAAVATSAAIRAIPGMPAYLEWLHAFRAPVVMDTGKARHELGWHPEYSAAQTLYELAATVR